MELNPYSRRFAERLFSARPEWRELATRDPDGFPPPGSLLVSVASPVPGRRLLVRTYGDQVTVDFGPHGWHTHFLTAMSRDEAAAFDAALRLVDDLLAERVAVLSRELFGLRGWTRLIGPGVVPRRPLVGRVEVYSWRGGRDAVLGRA